MDRAHISEKRNGFLSGIVVSLLFMAVLALFLLIVSSFLLTKTADPLSWIGSIGVFLPALTAFFGGIACGKRNGGAGALSGLATGAIFVFLLLILSRITGEIGRAHV